MLCFENMVSQAVLVVKNPAANAGEETPVQSQVRKIP